MIELDVCAAVMRRDNHLLLATRPEGTHLAGKWEFPGGKPLQGETLEDCIVREIQEELGVTVQQPTLLCDLRHTYPTKTIRLHFLLCDLPPAAVPHGHEGQTCNWFTLSQLQDLDLAGADAEFLRLLSAQSPHPSSATWCDLRAALATEENPPCHPPTV